MTFLIGLTGSIGMGKTTTAALFAAEGVPVFDADAAVHALYEGAATGPVEAAFPGVTVDGRIDRTRLSAAVLGNPGALKQLEAIVHPLVKQAEIAFLRACAEKRAPLAVLDIPLLFETGDTTRCDLIAVVSAPEPVQKQRVLARPGMTQAKFEAILARQVPDAEKRARAHVIIDTGASKAAAARQVRSLIRTLAGRSGLAAKGRLSSHA
jgi:dephospho-CoA kinase